MEKTLHMYQNFKRLLPYLWEDRLLFVSGFICLLLTSFGRLLDPLIVSHIIDVSAKNHSLHDMFLWGGMFSFVVLGNGIFSYFQIIWLSKLGVRVITKIKYNLFNHLLKLPLAYFDKNPVGEIIARVESDSERVKALFSEYSAVILSNVFFFIGMLAILFVKDYRVTTILMLPIVMVITFALMLLRYLIPFYKITRVLNAELTATVAEYVQAMPIVQVFNRQKLVENRLEQQSKGKMKAETRAMFYEYSSQGFFDFLLQTGFVLLVILLVAPKILTHAATLGTLIIFIQYAQRLFWPIIQLAENLNQIQRAFVSLQRIMHITDITTEKELRKGELPVSFEKEIKFDHVWFQYKEDEWVLKDVSFSFRKGEKIALVGSSGSGKTTTIGLLCGFYNIQKGTISVDGVNLDQIDIMQWREKIGLILQDIFLFPGNIIENVRIYNEEISEEQAKEAIRAVYANEFINHLDKKYQTELHERGSNISMGERQLLSFARAIAVNPDIIILDEATASIDAKTESEIQKSLDSLLHNKTAFIVAHRLASVVHCDNIMFFQDGNIIAQGSHNELLDSCPEYQKLVHLQFLQQTQEQVEES